MSKLSNRYQSLLTFSVLTIVLLFGGARPILAHSPHDVIDALEISPNYAQDQTVFISVTGKLLKSTDGGGSWKELVKGLDNTGSWSSIVISPAFQVDQTVFVAAEGDGVYRSQDGGNSWVKINQGFDHLSVYLLAISPDYERDQMLLAADSQGGLYKTQDGGASWRRVLDNGRQIRAMAFWGDGAGRSVLIGDHTGQLYLSTDGGEVWQPGFQFARSGAITTIALSPEVDRDGLIFVGTEEGGIFKSVDGGRSFGRVSEGLWQPKLITAGKSGVYQRLYKSIRSLAVSPDYEADTTLWASTWYEAVFQSTDGGQSWRLYNQGVTTNGQADTPQYKSPHFRNLRISKTFSQDQTIFLEGFDGLFKSTDGGRVWTQLETLPLKLITGLAVSPPARDGPATVAITTYGGGGYTSGDQGLTWAVDNRGLKTTRLADIVFSPHYDSDNTIFSASSGALLKSTDQGHMWARIDLGQEEAEDWRTRFSSRLHEWGLPRSLIRKFIPQPERDDPPYPTEIVVSPDFAVDNTLFFGTRRDGVFKSTDGGRHSAPVWSGLGQVILGLVISPDFSVDQTVFASAYDVGVYKTVDGGDTWQPVNSGLSLEGDIKLIISPDYQNDQTVFAGSISGLFKTTDGGQSWRKLAGLVPDGWHDDIKGLAISPDYKNDQTVMVAVRGWGLLKSADGGLSFVQIGSDLINHNYGLELIEFSPSYSLDRTIYGASGEEIFRSDDGGRHWTMLARPVRYEDMREVVHFKGQWETLSGADFSAETVSYSNVAGCQASLNFVGRGVTWIGATGRDQGMARVYIDGEYQGGVDQFSESQKTMVTSYSITDLAYGPHTITVEIADTKNSKSTDSRIEIDAFDVIP